MPPSPPQPHPRTGITFALALVFTWLWALFCNFVVELLLQLSDSSGMAHMFVGGGGLTTFLLGSMLVWVTLVLLVMLTGRLWVSAGLLFAALTLLGWANHLKLQQRQEPLYPSDLQFAARFGFLTDMVGVAGLLLPVAVGAIVVLLFARLGRATKGRYPHVMHQLRPRVVLTVRLVALVACASVLISAANFNSTGNPVRASYEAAGAKWAWWYQKLNYERNGVIGGFLYNTAVPAMKRPAGYSPDTMTRIAGRYAQLADRMNRTRDADALEDVNVVVVLSEAFSDPTRVPDATFAEDPIPFTRDLMQRTDSGDMLAQLVGGGTANMEFEALTGMSLGLLRPQMSSPYQMLIPKYRSWPSGVGYLEGKGHRPIAIHPYFTKMYQREDVYPVLGFDRFIGESSMISTERIEDNEFVSDEAAFDEVLSRIEQNTRPLFVNLVTMQNHFPTKDIYADPISMTGLSGGMKEHAEGFARGLRYTDTALAGFLQALREDNEKTAVIFYGDHLPGFWGDAMVEKHGLLMRHTPYFLWTDFVDLPHRQRPLTSPTQFLPMLLDDLKVPVPPYYALLSELRSEIPAISQGLLFDAEGEPVAADELSPRARRLLHDYRMVQYDFSVGERYSLERMFPQATQHAGTQVARAAP